MTAKWEDTTLSKIPIDIKSRISDNSLSDVLHAQIAGIVPCLAASVEAIARIPDTHLMQMAHQCYMLSFNLSMYACCAENGIEFLMLVLF